MFCILELNSITIGKNELKEYQWRVLINVAHILLNNLITLGRVANRFYPLCLAQITLQLLGPALKVGVIQALMSLGPILVEM